MQNISTVSDLYQKQKNIWKEEVEHYFGITPLDNWNDDEKVKEHLKQCCDKFWNSKINSNVLKDLFENGKCNDIDKLVDGSYEMIFDKINGFICLYATFKIEKENKNNEKVEEFKTSPLAYLPYFNDLCIFLNNTEYALRISANYNFSLISKSNNICKYQKAWTYDIEKDEFTVNIEDFDPYDNLTDLNRNFLEVCLNKDIKDFNKSDNSNNIYNRIVLTKENFKDALKSIPSVKSNSIMYFKFEHLSAIFRMVRVSSRFANPLKRVPIPINIVKMFSSSRVKDDIDGSFSNLILSTNKVFALENTRTILYKSQFNTTFQFDDSESFFDAFKTSTDKSAGRSRLILDDVTIKNGILYKNNLDMFNIIINNIKTNNNLSILSCSKFSDNNDPKRIMMTAKLRAQAIPISGEIDSFTHEIPARIVFGDFEGFNFGDSIIISKSFAKKLENKRTLKRRITLDDYSLITSMGYKTGDFISAKDFEKITNTFVYNNFRDIHIDSLDKNYLIVTARVPFGIGDKITNFHGSKGIVSMILDDNKMPFLKNDLGENMKSGPFDIVVSALSVYRRKSLGQIFEAWSRASGIDDVNNIQDAIGKYYDQMQEFSKNSVILFNGTETIKPCGINMFIRLNHDAIAGQSRSYLRSNYSKMLKFGEMELLNLAARGLNDIINELDVRSVSKHKDSFIQIKEMQKTGIISNNNIGDNLRFFNLLKTIGFDFNLRNPKRDNCYNNNNNNDPLYSKIQSILTDNNIDLFEDERSEY